MKILCCLFLISAFVFSLSCPARSTEEKLTITTYYPSPQGAYDKLQANRLAVGDINGDGSLTGADLPDDDGIIIAEKSVKVKRSIVLEPQALLPGSPDIGEMVYDSSDGLVKYYNGSQWVAQGSGGGGACYVSYWGNCFSGFEDKGKVGEWGRCLYYYGSADSTFIFGNAAVCSAVFGGSAFSKGGDAILCCRN